MSADPAQPVRTRALSNREKDIELLHRYSSRYLPQNHTDGSYRPGQFSNYASGNVGTSATATTTATTTMPSYNNVRQSVPNIYSGVSSNGITTNGSTSRYMVNNGNPPSNGFMYNTTNINSNMNMNMNMNNSNMNGSKKPSEHERRRSNLMNAQSISGWDQNSLESTTQEMGEAMRTMVESMQTRVDEQSRMLSDMEQRASQDSNFGKIENADKWSILEVCHWLNTIQLPQYMNNFSGLSIDGSILLNDLDENILATELGIKKIHLKKCLREITKLKEAVHSTGKITDAEKNHRIEELEKQVEYLKQANLKLKENIDSLKEQMKQLPLRSASPPSSSSSSSQIRSPRSKSPQPQQQQQQQQQQESNGTIQTSASNK